MYKPKHDCEKCGIEIESNLDEPFCSDCYELWFCECGNMLDEDKGESPGEGGFCRKCD